MSLPTTPALFVLLLAAGQGNRMQAGENKLFQQLEGKSLLEHALRPFLASSLYPHPIRKIYLLHAEADKARIQQLLAPLLSQEPCPLQLVTGGNSRGESVEKGLKQLLHTLQTSEQADSPLPNQVSNHSPSQAISQAQVLRHAQVLVHDAARCLLPPALLQRLLSENDRLLVTQNRPFALAPVLPLVDSLRRSPHKGQLTDTLDRSQWVAMQTPQLCFAHELYKAYRQLHSQGRQASDDLAALQALQPDYPLFSIEGDRENFKITYPEDLLLAKLFLQQPSLAQNTGESS